MALFRVAFFLVAFFLAMIIDLLVSTIRAFGPLTDVPSIEVVTVSGLLWKMLYIIFYISTTLRQNFATR